MYTHHSSSVSTTFPASYSYVGATSSSSSSVSPLRSSMSSLSHRPTFNSVPSSLSYTQSARPTLYNGHTAYTSSNVTLPFLPGNSFSPTGRDDYRRPQLCNYANEERVVKHGNAGAPTSSYPRGGGAATVPSWLAFDGQVLRFYAHSVEPLSGDSTYRVRNVIILFYLEDDTIQINEPRVEDSGALQGTILKRHRVPKDVSARTAIDAPDAHYTIRDFNVGATLVLYSRSYKLNDCDEFTRSFLSTLGKDVPAPQSVPLDPSTTHRQNTRASLSMTTSTRHSTRESTDTLGQFLKHDRQVLRFFGEWNDTQLYGDTHSLVIMYYLADDTVEVVEPARSAVSTATSRVFLSRQKLPRNASQTRTRLDFSVSAVNEFYRHTDFVLGETIDVFGRSVRLLDADAFTRSFYRENYNTDLSAGLTRTATVQDARNPQSSTATSVSHDLPPHNGFGDPRDAAGSCVGLVPKPPKRDFKKLLEKEGQILRFSAKIQSARNEIDRERRFIVSYYLNDDTIAVYEQAQRNSGLTGGKYFRRRALKKPTGDPFDSVFYTPTDLYSGAVLDVEGVYFELLEPDAYSQKLISE